MAVVRSGRGAAATSRSRSPRCASAWRRRSSACRSCARCGWSKLAAPFLTGEPFDADAAREMGLVTHVTDDVAGTVAALVAGILAGAPSAVAATKQLLRQAGNSTMARDDMRAQRARCSAATKPPRACAPSPRSGRRRGHQQRRRPDRAGAARPRRLDTSEAYRANRAALLAQLAAARRAARAGQRRRRREVRRAPPQPRQDAGPRAHRGAARPGLAVPRAVAARRLRQPVPRRRRHGHRHRRGRGRRVHDHRQRPHACAAAPATRTR